MRFHYGSVPDDPVFQPEAGGWHGIHEPNPLAVQLIAIPVMLILSVLWGVSMILFVLPGAQLSTAAAGGETNFWWWIVLFILMIPIHEFLHVLAHPHWGSSSNTIIGLWLSKGMFFAHYEGVMSRNRFLVAGILPYLVLGIFPIVLMAVFPQLIGKLTLFSFYGCIFACGDFIALAAILFQIPSPATVRNKGWRTYWKLGK